MIGDSVAGIAGFGLRGHRGGAHGPFDDGQWQEILHGVGEQRIFGLALAAQRSGLLALTDDQQRKIVEGCIDSMASVLQLEAMLAEVARGLRGSGIDWRVLKGPANAHLDYPHPEWRAFGDIDIMVHGDNFDAAAGGLEALGCRRRFDEPRPGFTARFGKGACFVAPNGLEIDLHRSFVAGPFASLGADDRLWRRPQTFIIGDEPQYALPQELRLVHASMHAVLGKLTPRLVPLRDVAQICEAVEPAALIDVAEQLGVVSVVARAVLQSSATLQLAAHGPLAAWALSYQPTQRQRRMVRAYTNPQRSYLGQVRAGARELPGIANKVAYSRSLIFPDRDYLERREGSYGRRIARALGRGRAQ